MKKTAEYLDELILRYNKDVKNDNQLSKLIGITRQAVSQYRSGQGMNTMVAVKVAMLLDLCPMETICSSMHEHANTEEEREFWKSCYDRYRHGC